MGDMNELLPCPFCGGEAVIYHEHRMQLFFAECYECNSRGTVLPTKEKAIAAWNTRAERTCHWVLEHSGTLYDKWRCSECDFLFVEPRCDQGYTDLEPNYCPNCGARVLDD